MPYITARDLKEDVLFRASEPLTGSNWNSKVIDYLNRVYNQLASGASEFTPEFIDDWWWLRSSGALNLPPIYTAGTVAVTVGLTAVTFSSVIASSKVGCRLRIDGHPDVFLIAAHADGSASATLDTAYTGTTDPFATFKLMRTDFTLASDVAALISPMVSYRSPWRIRGMSLEAMDQTYPLGNLNEGASVAFALTGEQTVRFSHGGLSDGTSMRVEYRYRPLVTALTDFASSIPLVPVQWRHVLADMALTYLLLDKNDNRSTAVASQARLVVGAMLRENRRRLVKVDNVLASIKPRTGGDVLQTNSGLVIG